MLPVMQTSKASISTQYLFREMQESDISEVYRIDKRVRFDSWSKIYFKSCLQSGHTCRVVTSGETVCGYSVMLLQNNLAYLLNLSVHPEHQRQGLGRWLLLQFFSEAKSFGANTITLEVNKNNYAACNLYTSAGFNITNKRYQYYMSRTGWDDALVMTRSL